GGAEQLQQAGGGDGGVGRGAASHVGVVVGKQRLDRVRRQAGVRGGDRPVAGVLGAGQARGSVGGEVLVGGDVPPAVAGPLRGDLREQPARGIGLSFADEQAH